MFNHQKTIMLMKKIYLALLGAMSMLSVSAQQGLGGLVLDSTYTTSADGVRVSKTVCEYNSSKLLVASYDSTYVGGMGQQLAAPVIEGRTIYTYDSDNHILSQEDYDYDNGQYILTAKSEFSEWNAEAGQPAVAVVSQVDEENPAAGLQLLMKTVVTKFHGKSGAETLESYTWDGLQWVLAGTTTAEFDGAGRKTKETVSMTVEGYAVDMETTFEYDSKGNPVKETSSTKMMGMNLGQTVTTFANEYYPDDNLKKVTTTSVTEYGTNVSMEYFFWGSGNTAGIRRAEYLSKKVMQDYDLLGRKVNEQTVRKGIYIVGGKKVVKK